MSIDVRAPVLREPPLGTAIFWTRDRVAAALGGGPRGPEPFGRVWTDSRTLLLGDVFVALSGERFDGHDHLAAAVDAGAAGVVVSDARRAVGLGVPAYLVPDTRAALGALARYHRRAWGGTVIGIVGANGKTTTKELLRAALGSRLEVHATVANYNNLIGVPLTLLQMPRHSDVAVVEMGTNAPGEIAALRAIAEPDIVVVTSIAEEHLEGLGDLAGVMREELAACEGAKVVIVPATQPEVAAAAAGKTLRVVRAGLEAGDVRAERWSLTDDGLPTIVIEGVEVHPPARGAHNARNAMLALAAAGECGVSAADAARGMAAASLPAMRVSWDRLQRATLINDAYNSNPESARAALDLLVLAGKGHQRVAVLGSMLELGGQSDELHDEVARVALASPVELLAGVGEFATAFARAGAGGSRVLCAPDAESLWPQVASRLQPDAVILLKGSRGVRLERLVPSITAWASG